MKKLFSILIAFVFVIGMISCDSTVQLSELDDLLSNIDQQIEKPVDDISNIENGVEMEDITNMKMNIQIGDKSFIATLEDNVATRMLIEMMEKSPISISMSDYSGFEKVGSLGTSLTTDNHQITTSAGDIVLYNGNQIVMFYGSNSWSYTRLGRIDDLTGWEEALGSGDVEVVFSLV